MSKELDKLKEEARKSVNEAQDSLGKSVKAVTEYSKAMLGETAEELRKVADVTASLETAATEIAKLFQNVQDGVKTEEKAPEKAPEKSAGKSGEKAANMAKWSTQSLQELREIAGTTIHEAKIRGYMKEVSAKTRLASEYARKMAEALSANIHKDVQKPSKSEQNASEEIDSDEF